MCARVATTSSSVHGGVKPDWRCNRYRQSSSASSNSLLLVLARASSFISEAKVCGSVSRTNVGLPTLSLFTSALAAILSWNETFAFIVRSSRLLPSVWFPSSRIILLFITCSKLVKGDAIANGCQPNASFCGDALWGNQHPLVADIRSS